MVALLIAYLPTLYGAYNRREVEVGLVAVRAGVPPWGPDLLARTRVGVLITRTDLPSFYTQWERWVVDVAESHSSYPVLLRFRSATADSSWLVALLAVLDSAALYHAAAPQEAPVEARFCLRTGIGALRQLAVSQQIPFDPDPRPDAPIGLTRAEFEQGIDRL